jgi:L-fuconolactonase
MSVSIDAHHHFWKYNPDEYGWIGESMSVIRRDFLPEDFRKIIGEAGIQGTVAVQARQTLEETSWLLELAGRHEFMRGVVGWVPLVDRSVGRHLEQFAQHPKFKGVRHVLHDEADDFYILREDFNRGIGKLKSFGLVYDILVFERHLPQTIRFVDRHPDQVFVIDHIAKPRIRERVLSPWRENITELARRANVYCKVSGMVTEADWRQWTEGDLQPYFDTVLSAFGPKRVIFGSDWPVILLASPYKRWVDVVLRTIAGLSPSERDFILGGTAVEAYRL